MGKYNQIVNVFGQQEHDVVLNAPVGAHYKDEVNVFGVVNMNLTEGSLATIETTVNLVDHSVWIGSFYQPLESADSIRITGSGKFYNKASSIGNDQGAIIDVNVIGTGTFSFPQYKTANTLEFVKGVSAGQTINEAGGAPYGDTTVQVDDPKHFHALVNLGYADLILEGLKADSYSYANDMLSLWKGNRVIDTVHLTYGPESGALGSPAVFGVNQFNGGLYIHNSTNNLMSIPGTALPLHA